MRFFTLAMLAIVSLAACNEDPLAGPCSDREDEVYAVMVPKDGDNFISQNPAKFTNCDSFICLSTNGSKPYCTKRCASDSECNNANGVQMECAVVTEFGSLACREPKHEFCDEDACLSTCTSSSDQTTCEKDCKAELCCERDEATQGVLEPASYCAAKDGQIAHDPSAKPAGT